MSKEIMSFREAAEYLSASKKGLRLLMERGLPYYQDGKWGRIRFRREEILSYLEKYKRPMRTPLVRRRRT